MVDDAVGLYHKCDISHTCNVMQILFCLTYRSLNPLRLPFSMADATNAICCAWVAGVSVTLTGVCGGVDLASPSIKRHLDIV